jgi:hypothetical protein
MSAQRKEKEAMLQALRGENLALINRYLGITTVTLSARRDGLLAAGTAPADRGRQGRRTRRGPGVSVSCWQIAHLTARAKGRSRRGCAVSACSPARAACCVLRVVREHGLLAK